jgi:flavin reductase (DIM6/NTAB) family NADH-FMN oxidoreductase RutF
MTTLKSQETKSQGIQAQHFKDTLKAHAAGVVVVTGQTDGVPAGLTATSFTAVSLDPPLVSFYAAKSSTTWPTLSLAEHFAVNVLAQGQDGVAAKFAGKGIDRFAGTSWGLNEHGVPLLEGAAAHLTCRPYDTIEIGDHVLVVGLVIDAEVRTEQPLLYHQGRFGRFIL